MFKTFTPIDIDKLKEKCVVEKRHQVNQLNNRWLTIEGRRMPAIIVKTYYQQYCKLNDFFNDKSKLFNESFDSEKKRWNLIFNSDRVQNMKNKI